MSEQERRREPTHLSPYVPLLLALVAFVGFLGFQTVQLIHDRSLLKSTWQNQQAPIAQSQKLRKQLNRLAGETAKLAQQGNPRAKLIVAQFARQGVSMTSPE